MVYCIGLTGNIASGKTTVATLFSELGIEVLNADQISRELTVQNTEAYKKIVTHYGASIVREDGELDRRHLREIIFSNAEERIWLEELLHPLIRQQLEQRVNLCKTAYCVVEIPLQINKTVYPYLNRILLVTSPLNLQLDRVMKRDLCTREQALGIIAAQPGIKERLHNADDVLINDSGLIELKRSVKRLHKKYFLMSNRNPSSPNGKFI